MEHLRLPVGADASVIDQRAGLVVAAISFVIVPDQGSDWIDNAKATGAMIVWLAAIAVALMALKKVNVSKLPFGVTIMRLWKRNVTDPRAEKKQRELAAAFAPLMEQVRDENNAHHDSNRARLSGIELATVSVKGELISMHDEISKTNIRIGKVETALHHSSNGEEHHPRAAARTKET